MVSEKVDDLINQIFSSSVDGKKEEIDIIQKQKTE